MSAPAGILRVPLLISASQSGGNILNSFYRPAKSASHLTSFLKDCPDLDTLPKHIHTSFQINIWDRSSYIFELISLTWRLILLAESKADSPRAATPPRHLTGDECHSSRKFHFCVSAAGLPAGKPFSKSWSIYLIITVVERYPLRELPAIYMHRSVIL